MGGRFLSCAWGVGAADESSLREPCAGILVADASMVYYSWEIIVGLMVGRDAFVAALCLVCLYPLLISI